MSNLVSWVSERLPKIYLLNSKEYPWNEWWCRKYEYPVGSGVLHEYPHYNFGGKRIPTGHVGAACLIGFYAIYKLYSLSSGSSSTKKVAGKGDDVKFPAPIRDYDKEKEEFLKAFTEAEQHHH